MKKVVILLIMLLIIPLEVKALYVNGERIDWNKRLTTPTNKNFAYMIHDGCEYTVAVPAAAQKLMYPTNMTNPIVLWQTTNYEQSKMDFFQEYEEYSSYIAYAISFRKNDSGVYYAMDPTEKDLYDWVYGEIYLNDYYLNSMTADKRSTTILHEMLHVFGLKDLYNEANKGSIMYGYGYSRTTTVLTSDANQVLNNKYN